MIRALLRLLRSMTPIPLRQFLYHVGLFFDASLQPRYPSMEGTLKYLKQWGFQPATVIDVGAYRGEWTTLFKEIFPGTQVLMVEAQCDKASCLEKVCHAFAGETWFEIALLGSQDGQTVKFVEMETGSSVFEESSSYPRQYLEKKQIALDSLLEKYPTFQQPDFIKLDVQGYELEVLKGASALLDSAEFVLMETSLILINQSCPLVADAIARVMAILG